MALLSVHLESINSELEYVQSTERQLLGFVDELHQEAQNATKKAEGLEAQLHQEAEVHANHIGNLQKELKRLVTLMQVIGKF